MGHFSDPEFVTFGSNDDPNSLREPHKLQYRTKGMVIKMKKRTFVLFLATAILLCFTLSGCGQIRNARPITDVHNLDGQRVGVALAWGPDYLLTSREDLTLMRYNNVAGAVTALCYNQVDAIAVEYPLAVDILASIDGLRCVEEPITVDHMAILIDPTQSDLLAEMNAFIDEFVSTEEYADLISRSQSPDGYEFQPVPLVGGDRVLHVGAVADGYPFTYINSETDSFEGTDVEFLCHFANAYGYDLTFYGDTWESMELGVQYGSYDIGSGGISELYRADIEKSESALMTKSFLPVNIVFIEIEDRDALKVKFPIEY